MLPARIPRSVPKPVKKVREGMSDKHLAFIRSLPCCVMGELGKTEAHHLLRTGERGMGLKSPDRYAIPLDAGLHRILHQMGDEDAFFADRGIDARGLAADLWRVSGDREAALTILWKARNHG